ncbi:MAG TPA: GspMb/PilO family protein [Burkholderiales bacterium]|nr:GspMb/PilO family protein [Burkholderiales bacterium]
MIKRVLQLRHELGALGTAALIMLAAAGVFFLMVLQPMQDERMRLEGALSKNASRGSSTNLSAFYGFLESKDETTTDALAKLYAIGTATGVELQSGSYRSQPAAGRLERYELALPVSGSYAQIRDFLNRVLAEIPALSLDQMSLRRDGRNDAAVHAELRLTLHKVAK